MYNPYGTSGYQSSRSLHSSHSHKNESEKAKKVARKTKSFARKVGIWLGIFVALVFILTWLCLGSFRFMMWRQMSFTGFPFGTRDYIVLFQNNQELRPTGGFISTYGVMEFNHGVYGGMEFKDIYGEIDEHQYIEMPLILSAISEADEGGYTFRDANFDPDFNVSADKIIEFYEMTNPDAKIDGVISVDFTFIENILEYYDSIYAEGYELTPENFFEIMASVNANNVKGAEGITPQEVLSPLVNKALTKTFIFPWRMKGMLNLLEQGLEEKHVLASFERSGLAKSFLKRNWDGSMPQSDSGDFLAVNLANASGLSSDRYLLRDVQYELDVTDSKDVLGNFVIDAEVTVTLSHEGIYNSPLSGDYSGYLRTMIPLGSEVLFGGSVSEDRNDSEVLGEILELAPGESITYTYSYELPEYVWVDGTYYLHLHKQPGTIADHYRIIVRSPEGTTLETQDFEVKENTALFETNLLTDVNLSFDLMSYDLDIQEYIAPNAEALDEAKNDEATQGQEEDQQDMSTAEDMESLDEQTQADIENSEEISPEDSQAESTEETTE